MIRPRQAIIVGLILCLAGLIVLGWFGKREENDPRALVLHGDAFLAHGDSVGKMLVIGGNARVQGAVTSWVAVVDGNLTVTEGGNLSGWVLIVNGQLTTLPGAMVNPVFILELPHSSAAINLAAWGVVFGLISGLSALAFWPGYRLGLFAPESIDFHS